MGRARPVWGAAALAVVLATPVAAQVTAPAAVARDAPAPAPAPVPAATAPQPEAPAASRHHTRGDPLEGFNRAMFSVNQTLDRLFFRPAAKAYETVVPKLIRKGFRHFFSNLREPLVFLNDVLQLKPKRALHTVGRFTINSTVGIAGVLDVAKTRDFNLPHHDSRFGDTLGRYGIRPGPYLFLPLVGPSDLRDLGADLVEGQALAFAIGSPYDRAEYRVTEPIITGLDLRAESDGALNALLGGAVDPYATLRSAYLQDRAATVAELRHRTARAASPLDDPLTDPLIERGAAGGTTVPAPQGSPLDDPLTDPAAESPPAATDPAIPPPPPATPPPATPPRAP